MALDSLMQIKRMIIAGFNVKEMILNETNFSAITDAVEKTVHTESNADFRLGLTYGSEADYLYNQSTGNAPAINFSLQKTQILSTFLPRIVPKSIIWT